MTPEGVSSDRRGRIRLILAAAVALGLLAATPASAVTPTEAVRAIFTEANRVVTDPATEETPTERVRGLLALVDRVVAFPEAAELALGREWQIRTAAEREEFLPLFTDLVERSLVMTVASKARLEPGIDFRYLGESATGRFSTVLGTMAARDGNDLPLEFRLVRRDDGWAIRDISVDGISVMRSYHAQFVRVMRSSTYRELVELMRKRALDAPDWWAALRPNGVRAAVDSERLVTWGLPDPAVFLSPVTSQSAVVQQPGESSTLGAVVTAATATAAAPNGREASASAPVAARSVAAESRQATQPVPAARDRTNSSVATESARSPRATSPRSTLPAPRTPVVYWVQVGAFRDARMASRYVEALLERNLPVNIGEATVKTLEGNERLTRVRVGPFPDRVAATAALGALRSSGYAPFLATD